jgi:hypothetical protein
MENLQYEPWLLKMTSHTYYVVAQLGDNPPEVIHECDGYSEAEALRDTLAKEAPAGMVVYVTRHYPGDIIEL